MRRLGLGRHALCSCVAAAVLTGCGGSQPPIGAPGAMPQSFATTTRAERGGSWMLPDAGPQNLLYVTDLQQVLIFSYPRGRYEGTLLGFQLAVGDCADADGNVYVADYGYGQLFEYAHGGTKRIRTLSPGDAGACAVDLTSGNLAVTNLASENRHNTGSVAIYTNAHGKPAVYHDRDFYHYYFCGYDDQGNLFVDGLRYPGGTGNFVFAELPKGGSQLTTITLDQYIGWPGGVQWDGQHIVVGDQNDATVYAFAINGSQGTLTGETQFEGAKAVVQTWIDGSKIIVPNAISGKPGQVLIYKYPAGGPAVKKIARHLHQPQGATVSKAPT